MVSSGNTFFTWLCLIPLPPHWLLLFCIPCWPLLKSPSTQSGKPRTQPLVLFIDLHLVISSSLMTLNIWDFLGGPVVKNAFQKKKKKKNAFQCREHCFDPWTGYKDPTCCRATKPVLPNYCAHTL